MSAKATAYVWENSPYTQTALLVHLAIADVANDDNNNRLWISQQTVARKVRCDRKTVTRAFAKMVEDGYLKLIEDNARAQKPNVYEFMMPVGHSVPSSGTFDPVPVGHSVPEVGMKSPTNSIELKSTTQGNTSTSPSGDGGTLFDPPAPDASKAKKKEEYTPEFEAAWKVYPRRIGKKRASLAFEARRKVGYSAADLTTAAANYAKHCKKNRTEEQYIKHGEGFWGAKLYFEDYINPVSDTRNIPSDLVTDRDESKQGIVSREELQTMFGSEAEGSTRMLTQDEIRAMMNKNRDTNG